MITVIDTTKKKKKKPDEKKPDDNKKPDDKKPDDNKKSEPKKEEKKPEPKKEEKKPEPKKEEKKPEPKKEEKKPEEKKEETKTKQPEDGKKEEKKEEKKEPPKMKEKIVETESNLTIDQVEILFGTPKGILEKYTKRENTQSQEDEVFHKASSFKNSLEQYIYATKEKLDTNLKGYYTDDERKNLTVYMDKLYEWLYSDDEKLYDMKTLEEKSKAMKILGDEIYKRNELWDLLRKNFITYESVVGELNAQVKGEKEKLDKKQFTYVTMEDINKINELITDSINNAKKKRELCEPAPQINRPPVEPSEIEMLYDNLRKNVKKIYDDAEFKVKEAERKRKEEEEKKKKEEEEKKKKEEEGKKDGEKKEDKKEEKKDPTHPDNDVNMKDSTAQNNNKKDNPPKNEKPIENEKMDVE